jgi:CHAD domain-containing protein
VFFSKEWFYCLRTGNMALHLKDGEKLGSGIRRIAKKEIGAIIEHLAGRRLEGEGRALHEARKNLKKVRATLRLVREQLGEQVYQRENRDFRDVARALSPRRDAEVLVKTLAKLRRSQKRAASPGLNKLDQVLLGRHQQAFKTADAQDELEVALLAARHRAKHWPIKKLDWSDLLDGLEGSYRRARKAFRTAGETRTDENLHEWRKRVKDLWYQLRLLESACSEAVGQLAKEMKCLSEYLGDDHDLMMLNAAAQCAGLAAKETQVISDWIQARRRKLQANAFELGQKLFDEKPPRFTRRIEGCRNPDAGLV